MGGLASERIHRMNGWVLSNLVGFRCWAGGDENPPCHARARQNVYVKSTEGGPDQAAPSGPVPHPGHAPSWLIDVAVVGALTIAVTAYGLHQPSMSMDETSLVLYPDLVGQGHIPNRDFFTPYGPATYWLPAGVFSLLGGPSIFAERLIGMGYHVLVAVAVWALCRRHGRRAAVVCGSLSGLLAAGLMLPAYAWLLAVGMAALGLAAMQRRCWLLAGVLWSMSISVRPEFLLVLCAVAAVLIRNRQDAGRFGLGVGLGAIPLLAHASVAGEELARNVFVDRLGQPTGLPFPPVESELRLAFLVLAASVLLLVVQGLRTRSRLDVSVAVFAFALLPQAVQRADRVHLLFVSILVVPLALGSMSGRIRRLVEPYQVQDLIPTALRLAYVLILGVGVVVWAVSPRAVQLKTDGQSLLVTGDDAARVMSTILREADRAADDGTVLIGTTDASLPAVAPTYLYLALPNHTPDAYYLEPAPGVSERAGSGLLADYREARVLLLSHFSPEQSAAVFPFLPHGTQAVNEYVESHFCLRRSISDFVDVYERCG
jgi:hypothetical protein